MSLDRALRLFCIIALAVLVFYLIWWVIDYLPLDSTLKTILHGVEIVLAVFVVVGVLLRLIKDSSGPLL